MSSISTFTIDPIDDEVETGTEPINGINDKEGKRTRYSRSAKKARRKAELREAQTQHKGAIHALESWERTQVKLNPSEHKLPGGEPLRRGSTTKEPGGVRSRIKRIRKNDRQVTRQQCREAAYDHGETVVTGAIPVQRANVRALALS